MTADATITEELMLKKERLQLLRQKVEMVKANGLAFYKPWDKQDQFHRAGSFKRRMMRAGNRTGKSTLGVVEDCSFLVGERPWYPLSDPARTAGIPQHSVKGLVITTSWDKVDEVFTSQRGNSEGKLWKYLPKGWIKKVRRNHDGVVAIVEGNNGSILRFDTVKSWTNDPQSSESTDWDFIHVDEPCPEGMWKSASRGLMDRHGAAWFTLTPLSEFWINDLFFPADTNATNAIQRKDVWAIHASTYENPYLSRESIAAFEADLTEDEKQCRLNGLPLHLTGLVYKQFAWNKHVLKEVPKGWASYTNPPINWPVYVQIDYHPRKPHCVLFCAVSPEGQRFYFRDVFHHCSTEQLAGIVREGTKGLRFIRCRIDPSACIQDPITGSCGIDELAKHGVYVEKATKALGQGILRVQGELEKDGEIYFAPTCSRLLYEILRYVWDEDKDKPLDKDDHAMECLYRMELDDVCWLPEYKDTSKPVEELSITSADLTLERFDYAV